MGLTAGDHTALQTKPWMVGIETCAKPTTQPTVYRLSTHEKRCILPSSINVFFYYLQQLIRFHEGTWGARGRVFESLRPDHIIQ